MTHCVAVGEDRRLGPISRQHLRGSVVERSGEVPHYEPGGPEGGDVVLPAGTRTAALFPSYGLTAIPQARGLAILACGAYGRGRLDRVRARYDETLLARRLFELKDKRGLRQPVHLVRTSIDTPAERADHVLTASSGTLGPLHGLTEDTVLLARPDGCVGRITTADFLTRTVTQAMTTSAGNPTVSAPGKGGIE